MTGKKKFTRDLLKYSGVFLICGWMFFLGVLVGRGTAPVSFDTKSFQKKLAAIAGVKEKEKKIKKKTGLDFYETLKKPVSAMDVKIPVSGEIVGSAGYPIKVKGKNSGKNSEKNIKIIKSRKTMSIGVYGGGNKRKFDLKPVKSKITELSLKKNIQIQEKIKKKKQINPGQIGSGYKKIKRNADFNSAVSDKIGVYTIQVAAYRNLNDALKLMENLKKKGYTAYRTMGKKGDKIWYRVRIGSFMDRKKAMQFEKQLESNQLKGIIVRIAN